MEAHYRVSGVTESGSDDRRVCIFLCVSTYPGMYMGETAGAAEQEITKCREKVTEC